MLDGGVGVESNEVLSPWEVHEAARKILGNQFDVSHEEQDGFLVLSISLNGSEPWKMDFAPEQLRRRAWDNVAFYKEVRFVGRSLKAKYSKH